MDSTTTPPAYPTPPTGPTPPAPGFTQPAPHATTGPSVGTSATSPATRPGIRYP